MGSANLATKNFVGFAIVGYITALFVVPAIFLGFLGLGSLLTYLTDCCVLPEFIRPGIIPMSGATVVGVPTALYGLKRRLRKFP